MRLLLTGASGFVGRAILAALDPRVEVTASSRSGAEATHPSVRWLPCDLLEVDAAETLIAASRPEIVVHAAWHTRPGSYADDPENGAWLAASERLLEAFIAGGGRRFVGIGSCAEYRPGHAPCHETATPLCDAPAYATAKAAFGRRLEDACRAGRIETAHARLFFLYGPGEKPSRLVPGLIARLRAGEPAETGPGARVRDFMHVRDAGRALARLAVADLTGPINIASGVPTRIADIAACLGELAGRPDLVRVGARAASPDEPAAILADVTRQTLELGYRPETPLLRGLEEAFSGSNGVPTPRRDRARYTGIPDGLYTQPE